MGDKKPFDKQQKGQMNDEEEIEEAAFSSGSLFGRMMGLLW